MLLKKGMVFYLKSERKKVVEIGWDILTKAFCRFIEDK